MEYNKLISATGFSGLFELVSSKNDGAIVKSLEDDSTKFISTRQHQFSHLESIEVYTAGDNLLSGSIPDNLFIKKYNLSLFNISDNL
jgi:hypothetical protein